jgi:hypothetical protein
MELSLFIAAIAAAALIAWGLSLRSRRVGPEPASHLGDPATHGHRRSMLFGLALVVIIIAAYALWQNGNFDTALSHVGLNHTTCAENLFGNRMCGDELVAFCEQRYDPAINGDTCRPVLKDAGYTGAQLAALHRDLAHQEQQQVNQTIHKQRRREQEREQRRAQRGRHDAQIGTPAKIGSVTYTVTTAESHRSIGADYDTVTAKPGRKLVALSTDFHNAGRKPVLVACGGLNATLVDDQGRRFSPDDEASIMLMADACGDTQAGDDGSTTTVFSLPADATPTRFIITDPDGRQPEMGGEWLSVDLTTARTR